jgi:hypothetical protein|tara:strand:- start:977 stop:1132 length:156 start_codon:yes stop_codon:yes gene_type:complete
MNVFQMIASLEEGSTGNDLLEILDRIVTTIQIEKAMQNDSFQIHYPVNSNI